MYKKLLVIPIMLLGIMSMTGLLFADTTTQATAEESIEEPVDTGNKICPVSGDKIEKETKTTYEYEGKIYNFCCASCIDEFKKDPEKYIKKVEEELKSESEAKSKEHMMMPESKASDHHSSHH